MVQCVSLRLEADGLDPLDLMAGAYKGSEFDPGFPIVREVAQDAPDADGSIDTSSLSGARVVTLGVTVNPAVSSLSRWQLTQQLKPFLNPKRRPSLFVQYDDADPELMLVLRPSNLADRIVPSRRSKFDVTCQWVCPSGILESAELHEESIIPGAGLSSGLEFGPTLQFGPTLEFPLVDPPGTVEITNAGDRDAYPIIRAFGPFGIEGTAADETELTNATTGKSLVFAGMGIAAGDYLEIDFRRKTAYVNSVETNANSRLSYRVFPTSSWWSLVPGVNEITFGPDTYTGNVQAVVFYRDAYS